MGGWWVNPSIYDATRYKPMFNPRREENCFSVTPERKYYKVGQALIKRSLRPTEWQTNPFTGTLIIPRFGKPRLYNEAASMAFIARHTSIPIPELYCCFEDDEAVYLVIEYIEGVSMNALKEEKQKVIQKELEVYV